MYAELGTGGNLWMYVVKEDVTGVDVKEEDAEDAVRRSHVIG